MDFLGKKGEEAAEQMEAFEQRLGSLESHLDAVDTALQDFVDNYTSVLHDELDYHEDEILRLQEVVSQATTEDERMEKIESRLDRIERKQKEQEDELRNVLESDLETTLSDLISSVKDTKKFMKRFRERMVSLEEKVDDLEGELMVEVNNRDYDFDRKLDKREFKDSEEELREEVKKLKASVYFLADELDSADDIEIE